MNMPAVHIEGIRELTADLEFLNEARRRFHGERFDSLYRAWRVGELDDAELRAEFAQIKPGRAVYFDTYLVNGMSLRSLWVLTGVKRGRKRIITLRFTVRVTLG